jgi:hypothetical protein
LPARQNGPLPYPSSHNKGACCGPSLEQISSSGDHGAWPAWPRPEVLEKSANLVLEVPFDLHEQSPADEEGFDRVAVDLDVAPVSSPMRATRGACDFMNAAIASGFDASTSDGLRESRNEP